MIYLAGPYSSNDPDVRQQRFVEHCTAAAKLAALDRMAVFSPIAHGHALCDVGGLDRFDHEFWMRQCLPFLDASELLIVLTIDGWRESKGTQVEIAYAEASGIQIVSWGGACAESLLAHL